MFFGEKKTLAQKIIADLARETLSLSHSLTPIMISPNHALLLPTSKKPHSVDYFLKKITNHPLEKAPLNTTNALHTIHTHLKKKSLLIMIGDFLEEIDFKELCKKHTLYLIILRDSFEGHPYALGEGDFSDLESEAHGAFYFGKKAALSYAKRYQKHDEKLFSHLRKLGIAYQKVTTTNLPIT